jgi:hypothetical protein
MIRAMSDDRAIAALERGMGRPLALAVASYLVAMGVFLVGVVLIVDSTTRVSFPSSVAVTTPPPSPSAAPVSFPATVLGMNAYASLTRGGQATAAPTGATAGTVAVTTDAQGKRSP